MPPDDLTLAVARLLGFQRVGTDLAEVINDALIATDAAR